MVPGVRSLRNLSLHSLARAPYLSGRKPETCPRLSLRSLSLKERVTNFVLVITDLVFPTVMHIDYVRIYQKAGQESITCDPPGYPTTEYIMKEESSSEKD